LPLQLRQWQSTLDTKIRHDVEKRGAERPGKGGDSTFYDCVH
jgi:hypothetical protein